MKAAKRTLLCSAAWLLFPYSHYAHADWAQSADALVVKAMPTNRQLQVQNPPTFTWAPYAANTTSYTLEIRTGTTVVRTYTSSRNWYLPSEPLPVGSYTWRVRPTNSSAWSDDRAFEIAGSSKQFLLPSNDVLRANILKRPRPRGLPASLPAASAWTAAMKAERGAALQGMSNEVVLQTANVAVPADANWPLVASSVMTAAYAAQMTSVRSSILLNSRQLEASALMFRLTGEQRFLTEALRRGDALAALNPNGPTSYVNQAQGSRSISLALSKALDGLGSNLDATRRAAWMATVKTRTAVIYQELLTSNGGIEQKPYDAFTATNIGFLAAISALVLGEIPEATTWFDFSVRYFSGSLMVWSGPEGGFSEGTAYAEFSADNALQIWQPLLQASGIDLFAKPWSAGLARFFMEFVPPGAKTHMFGDAQEIEPVYRLLKAYVSRFATPEAAWYVKNLTVNEDMLTLLQAPYPLPVSTVTETPRPPANGALFPSIGWSAMHSNLADLKRTSVYFKSTPYGSFSHSHGNQNAFVLTSANVPLLIQTGWYDWFGSPMHTTWYRQSKAANAITFDGGVGQMVDGYRETLVRNGAITAFSTTPSVDYVEGNATPAYGGALSLAVRQLWYLRDSDAIVVRDKLAAPAQRSFEWNLHAAAPILVDGSGNISIVNQGRSVCIKPIADPGVRYEKRTGPPPKAGSYEEHGALVRTTKASSAEFLVLLDVGCKNLPVSITATATGRQLTVGTQKITIAN
ncbi:heparinase II/III family protein [Janthinobacterium sp. SUN118]|uniref:heparinase II/III domain-containing protein n=1 Tax=Janthinobacterium sp. SUN118 TaxID=3004100 RepID=UPI0025B1E4FB|nr:heparinase II/III family protein [Janthinobacterium sp. SUN118]MDN2711992.1 heparinase II/III family protein [Janthinobacterium sp. SUN118]